LASSAALEVAFAKLLSFATNSPIEALELAKLCQRAELAFPGTPCGIMDMYIAAFAKVGHGLLLDCRSLESKFVPLPPVSEAVILIVDTGVKHNLATSAYADRRRACALVATAMGVSSLRDVDLKMLQDANLEPQLQKRALHVIAENTRTILAAEALSTDNLAEFGRLMFASHDSLRDLYEVSCAELDTLVDAARRLQGSGLFGARMTGGGFGGSAIMLCRPEAADFIIDELRDAFQEKFGSSPHVFPAHTSCASWAFDLSEE
jgi:galactokinase